MVEAFFDLSRDEQHEALEYARAQSGRPAHLLEKDIWVVWALQTLFDSPLSADLTFKGGTSLSKAFKVIDRFSEDIDLTCDIRKLIPDLTKGEDVLPKNRSQAKKWTDTVRRNLPIWIGENVQPVLEAALQRDKLDARIESAGSDNDSLLLHYPALSAGTGYVRPTITLEFGGRATGEPHDVFGVSCDIAELLPQLSFPTATPVVMSIARTFWEKATAAHVFCAQGRIRGERYARHWYDLAAIASSRYFSAAVSDRTVATTVARHKSWFFSEKDRNNRVIDYESAVSGGLRIVPEGEARTALSEDYAAMMDDQIMIGTPLSFDELLAACAEIEATANEATGHRR